MSIGDGWETGSWEVAGWIPNAWLDNVFPFATTNGLSFTEAQIVAGSQDIVITLGNDTWVATGGAFEAQRQNIIDGITSNRSESNGWNNVVRDAEDVTSVVRTSATVVTVTLTAAPTFDITISETITVTVPATAVVAAGELVAAPALFAISDGGAVYFNDVTVAHNEVDLYHNDPTLRHLDAAGLRHKRV